MRLPLVALAAALAFGLAFTGLDVRPDRPFRESEAGTGPAAPPVVLPEVEIEEGEASDVSGTEPVLTAGAPGEPTSVGRLRLIVELSCAETGRRLVPVSGKEEDLGAFKPRNGRLTLDTDKWEDFGYEWLEFVVEPPEGYVMEAPGRTDLIVHRSRYAKEFRVHLVAWPEADLRVVVKEPDGRAAAGAVAEWVFMLGRTREVSAALTDALGVARITGVPAIPGEPLQVIAAKGDREAASPKVRVNRSTEETWAAVVLPAEPGEASLYRGPGGCVPGCRRWPRYPEPHGSAALRIHLRRVDGRPAPQTYVVVRGRDGEKITWKTRGRTNAEGDLLVDDLPGGPADVRVFEDGFLMAEARPVMAHAGTTTDIVIREDRGVPLTIRVTDARGRAIGGVAVELNPSNADDFTWLEGDRQYAGLFTGPDGVLRVPRLPKGEVHVKARLGTRTVGKWVEVGSEVTLVIPD